MNRHGLDCSLPKQVGRAFECAKRKVSGHDYCMTNARDIAQSIIDEILSNGSASTYQHDVVSRIAEEFGAEWVQTNANGNVSIHKDVQREFRKLKSAGVRWNRDDFSWSVVGTES